ncbi:MAG: hypothetical protein KKA73_23960 [Chloroflexi bacterium]|nr:hypothetical protein [Chloroflexota bacterium]MBU1750747.1 hypothetical protein [Chloroflexota bacterium]
MDAWNELQTILARLSPARQASLLDYARYLAACEELNPPAGPFDQPHPPGDDVPDDCQQVLDDCQRRGYGGLLGREP